MPIIDTIENPPAQETGAATVQSNGVPSRPAVYKTLDVWRGAAALWVVMFHVAGLTAAKYPAVRSSLLYHVSAHGYLGVWIFFVISGYCIANSGCQTLLRGQSVGKYFQARLRRIYPPYFASAVLYLVYAAAVGALVAHKGLHMAHSYSARALHEPFLYYAANFTLTQRLFHQNYLQIVYWTLCYEIAFYLIVGLAIMIGLHGLNQRRLLYALYALTIGALLLLMVSPSLAFYPLDFWPAFGVGVLVYGLLRSPRERIGWVVLGVVTVEILCLVFQHRSRIAAGDNILAQSLLFSLGLGYVLLALHRYDKRLIGTLPLRGLAWVGLFSYSLYLIHFPIVTDIFTLFGWVGKGRAHYGLCLVVCLIVSVAAARVFYQFFERPFLKAKRQIAEVEHSYAPNISEVVAY